MAKDVDPKYVMVLPTPFVVIAVGWGEGDKHLYQDGECKFFQTREGAADHAYQLSKDNPGDHFVLLECERIFQGKVKNSPVGAETGQKVPPQAM